MYKFEIQLNDDQLWEEYCLNQVFLFKHHCCANCLNPQQVETWKLCASCHKVLYCSKECQTQHWKEHKKYCKTKKQPFTIDSLNQTWAYWKTNFKFFEQDCVKDFEKMHAVSCEKK